MLLLLIFSVDEGELNKDTEDQHLQNQTIFIDLKFLSLCDIDNSFAQRINKKNCKEIGVTEFLLADVTCCFTQFALIIVIFWVFSICKVT